MSSAQIYGKMLWIEDAETAAAIPHSQHTLRYPWKPTVLFEMNRFALYMVTVKEIL